MCSINQEHKIFRVLFLTYKSYLFHSLSHHIRGNNSTDMRQVDHSTIRRAHRDIDRTRLCLRKRLLWYRHQPPNIEK